MFDQLFPAFFCGSGFCAKAIPNGWEFLRYVFNHNSEHVKNMSLRIKISNQAGLGHALSDRWMFCFESVRVSIKILAVCSIEGHLQTNILRWGSFIIWVFPPC